MILEIGHTETLPEIRTDAYRTLVRGEFAPNTLKLHIQGTRKTYSPDTMTAIEASWQKACQVAKAEGRRLFNGKLFSLLGDQMGHGALNLLLGETDYKELVGTNLSLGRGGEGAAGSHQADGLAVSSALLTSDGFLLIGRRSTKVYDGPGKLHVCGGHPDPEHALSAEEIVTSENPLFRAMEKEIGEEFHVTAGQISAIRCLGLIRSAVSGKPEVIFETVLKLTSAEALALQTAAKDKAEHREIHPIPAEQGVLLDYLEKHHGELTVPALAALIFFGARRDFWREAPR